MKLKLLLFAMLMGVGSGFAQDVITLINGLTITAKVEEINNSSVKYRKFSNLNGPIYTLAQENIGKITYENGDVEYFMDKPEQTESKTVTIQNADAIEQNYSQNQTQSTSKNSYQPKTELNEYELLRMAETENINIAFESPIFYKKKAKTYRLVGWIGGGFLLVAGFTLPFILSDYNGCCATCDYGYYLGIAGAPIAAAGIGWGIGWNVAAHKLMKKAQLADMYSMAILQTDELKIGKSSFVGSLNIMGDTFTKTKTLGLGLTLNL